MLSNLDHNKFCRSLRSRENTEFIFAEDRKLRAPVQAAFAVVSRNQVFQSRQFVAQRSLLAIIVENTQTQQLLIQLYSY